MSGPCMCGDPACSSCGPAQGFCPYCAKHDLDGCVHCDPDKAADDADRLYDEARDAELEASFEDEDGDLSELDFEDDRR